MPKKNNNNVKKKLRKSLKAACICKKVDDVVTRSDRMHARGDDADDGEVSRTQLARARIHTQRSRKSISWAPGVALATISNVVWNESTVCDAASLIGGSTLRRRKKACSGRVVGAANLVSHWWMSAFRVVLEVFTHGLPASAFPPSRRFSPFPFSNAGQNLI